MFVPKSALPLLTAAVAFVVASPAAADLISRRAQTILLPGHQQPVAYGTPRVESPYTSSSPDTFAVGSVVSIFAPLKPDSGAPPECDYLSYVRYRHRDGPTDPLKADRVMSFMPGTIAGASSFDQVAKSTIFELNNRGLKAEVWALDRRANCLEDNTGILEAVRTKNQQVGFDYYYNGKSINGRKFGGWIANGDRRLAWLADQGVDATSSDWYEVVTRELPDQRFRTTKHVCSGHSLGGPLTAWFLAYDRDGDPKTTGDAGYNQCAGAIGYDTTVSFSSFTLSGNQPFLAPFLERGFDGLNLALKAGIVPRSVLTALPVVLNSEVTTFLGLLGAAAGFAPNAEAPVSKFPRSLTTLSASQFFFSKTIANFVTFLPFAFNFRATNAALLGAVLSDRSQAFGFLQTSVGFGTGGKIEERNFPGSQDLTGLAYSNVSAVLPLLKQLPQASQYPLAVPTDAGFLGLGRGPLYKWLNYDEIAEDGSNVAKANNGQPFTKAADQTTDILELGRALSEVPLDFTEHYYPLRVTTDGFFWNAGAKNAIRVTHPDALSKRPILNLVGTEGIAVKGNDPLGNHVMLPGYNHLDVLLAARKQNLGRKELSSISTADFVAKLGAGVLA